MLTRSLSFIRLLAVIIALSGALVAHGRERKKEPLPKPPPQPVEQVLEVRRGEKLTITLKVYGSPGEPLRYLVRSGPDRGKLTKPLQRDTQAATVVYQPPANLGVLKDGFTYAVQNSAGVSASVPVEITILDEPPMLSLPDPVKFPEILAGTTAVQEVEVVNRGGGLAEGLFEVDPPWSINGPAEYRLRSGEKATVKLVFTPLTGGRMDGELRFTSDRARSVALVGYALAPLAVEPARVDLTGQPGDPKRTGAFVLINNTEDPQTVRFAPSSRLKLPQEVAVEPKGKVTVTVQTAPEAVGPFAEQLTGNTSGALLSIPVQTGAAGAVLQTDARELRFDANQRQRTIRVRNAGGAAGYWRWEAGPPFEVAEPDFRLEPGQARELVVQLAAAAAGNQRTALRLIGEAQTVQIPAEVILAEGMGPTSASRPRVSPAQGTRRAGLTPGLSRPAKIRNTALETADSSGPAGTPMPIPVRLVTLEQMRAVLAWEAAPGAKYRVERQLITKAKGARELTLEWKALPGTEIKIAGKEAQAELAKLEPGKLYNLRIVDVAGGGEPDSLADFQLITPAKEARRFFTLPWMLTGVLLVLLIAVAVERRRRRG